MKQCIGCGNLFQPSRAQQKRCVKNCGRSEMTKRGQRKKDRDIHALTFIGVDGEGVNHKDGTHEYVLLSVGDQSYTRPDGGHLHWREIFTFLYEQFLENPDAVFVGYYLGYDFAQWVKTMPESRGRMLYDKKEIAKRKRTLSGGNTVPFPVDIDDWECDILPGRRFKLRPAPAAGSGGAESRRHGHQGNPHKWMYVCDAGPFFQRSFLSAINPKDWPAPIVSDEDYALILEGKERRADAQLDAAMVRYNLAENRALAALMTVMNEGLVSSGIRLKKDQWFGPGQAAQAWLNLISAPTGEQIRETVPKWALDAARATYFGGWFEIFRHGHIPGVSYENDEISSYPYTISTLPCLLHGEWTRGEGAGTAMPGHLRMVQAEVWGNDKHVGAMLHRTERGTVLRPSHTSGWYWWHEVEAAQAAGVVNRVEIGEWVDYEPCACPPPLQAIKELFELRKTVGKNTPQGKALRLVYNSAYGKMAQSVGEPKFANAIYASLITAGTRTRILQAIATHPNKTRDLLMVATDGVYFYTPHPGLEYSDNELGKWELQAKYNLTLFMPGMYWDDKTRDRLKLGEAPQLKSRGVSAKALAEKIADIDALFHNFDMGEEWPSIDLDISFQMISPAQAIQRGDWSLAGKITQSTEAEPIVRSISANPVTKRASWLTPKDDNGLCYSFLYHESPFGSVESTSYTGRFGDETKLILTLDGTDDMMAFREMLGWH